jgi:2-methylcitrate dehydratase PrpD
MTQAQAKVGKKEDLAFPLARYVANIKYADIPKEAVEVTKNCILDTLGVILPASTGSVPGCREFVELIIESSGKKESTILQFGAKVPAWLAAFANSGMAHALDYDDIYSKTVVHPSCMVVPSAFAVAERVGRVNGKDLIVAVTIGNDISCRMGLSIDWQHDWHLTPLFGRFGCAATSGKLMGLPEDGLLSAFGNALNEAPGSLQVNRDAECTFRAFEFGLAARGGVFAALLAEKGITGPRESFEGAVSLYPVYFKGQKYNRNALLTDLGKRFEVMNLGFKPWPSCSLTHSYIGATLQAIEEHHIKPQEIKQVTVFVNNTSNTLFEPLEMRRRPPTIMGAKYSLPFTLAVAILRKKVVISDYTPESIKDRDTLELAQKVVPKLDPSVKMVGGVTQGIVEITNKQGKRYRGQVDIARGRPENPMSRDDLIAKFRDCACHAAKPLSRTKSERVIEMIMNIEGVEDVSEIVQVLA